ncbi:hypothetical protein CDAR_499651 [Caerostris darwini]|uniref:Uncharacterized protein n=1 Tax=Caerostris darwini TaxID=1538125 RepID=A0AAV4QB96_9ARAC|nr:hypothetical protein CDAR_499651 [Caerostris darwini]
MSPRVGELYWILGANSACQKGDGSASDKLRRRASQASARTLLWILCPGRRWKASPICVSCSISRSDEDRNSYVFAEIPFNIHSLLTVVQLIQYVRPSRLTLLDFGSQQCVSEDVMDQPVINYAAGQAKRPSGHCYGFYARVEDGRLRQYVSAASFLAPMRTGILLTCLLKFLLIFTHCLRSCNLDGLCNNVSGRVI